MTNINKFYSSILNIRSYNSKDKIEKIVCEEKDKLMKETIDLTGFCKYIASIIEERLRNELINVTYLDLNEIIGVNHVILISEYKSEGGIDEQRKLLENDGIVVNKNKVKLCNKKYYIYMVRCSDDSIYTGITTDVERRFIEHFSKNKKGAKYTHNHSVEKIEAIFFCTNRVLASKLEFQIKKLTKDKKEALINDNSMLNILFDEKIEVLCYRSINIS